MKLIIWLILLPQIVSAQETRIPQNDFVTTGIQFEQTLSWQQILAKAKAENKFIFADCYATWCAPCKLMDKEVYPLKLVGDYMNARFISVKIQIDTSKNDNGFIKTWYADAHDIIGRYKVSAFPTYLFFSPDGEIVHRYLNALPDSLFLKVAGNALNPEKQYYTLLKNYSDRKRNYSKLNYLATITKQIGNDSLAGAIAIDYLHNYLNTLTEKDLHQKKYLDFINFFPQILNSNDRIFNVVYNDGDSVDKLIGQKDFSKSVVSDIITRETINPKLWPDKKPIATAPDWDQLKKSVRKKYNKKYTDLVVLNAQLKWYTQKKGPADQIKYNVQKIDRYGLDTAGIGWAFINNMAWDLFFTHCNNKDTLNKAIGWMEVVVKAHNDDQISIDTYANLLYKAGRINDAIFWEEKAVKLEDQIAQKEKRDSSKEFKETLEKMRNGIPTWVKK